MEKQQTAIDFFLSKMYDRFGIRNVADMADEINQSRELFRQQIEEAVRIAYMAGMEKPNFDASGGLRFSENYYTQKYGQ